MPSVAEIFKGIGDNIKSNPDVAKSVNGVYQFNIGDKSWTVNAKDAPGVTEGKAAKADCTITVKEDDFVALATGQLNGQQAFMQGKLKVAGNMAFAMKLGTVLKNNAGASATMQAKL